MDEDIVKTLGLVNKSRLESLTDGIFGFAMTLLVVNINLPPAAPAQTSQAVLVQLGPDFLQYLLAFSALAAIWVAQHQQYYYIKYLDYTMLWIKRSTLKARLNHPRARQK